MKVKGHLIYFMVELWHGKESYTVHQYIQLLALPHFGFQDEVYCKWTKKKYTHFLAIKDVLKVVLFRGQYPKDRYTITARQLIQLKYDELTLKELGIPWKMQKKPFLSRPLDEPNPCLQYL